jgi:hypothetical protein
MDRKVDVDAGALWSARIHFRLVPALRNLPIDCRDVPAISTRELSLLCVWLNGRLCLLLGGCLRFSEVLCPMNQGSIGVRELNTVLQGALNPVRPGEPAAERFGWRFQVRDKVIQTENDYRKEVFNGDIGTIEKIDPVEQEVFVRFDERLVVYDYGELDEVSLAYAVTIHKSQGSEFPVAMQHYMLLQRNLIYTGITRAKRLLVVVGQKKALGLAVRNDQSRKRYSGLLSSLKEAGTDRQMNRSCHICRRKQRPTGRDCTSISGSLIPFTPRRRRFVGRKSNRSIRPLSIGRAVESSCKPWRDRGSDSSAFAVRTA